MVMQFKKITQLDLLNKVVFIRTDMNVPVNNNQITDETRIVAGLKTIKYALDEGAKVIIATHLGRPTEGHCTSKDSVAIVARRLSDLLGYEVPIVNDITLPIKWLSSSVVILQNVRCNIGEKANALELGEKYAALCDVFIHDAFATAHRAEASTDAIGRYVPEVAAGMLMSAELESLKRAMSDYKKPLLAIVGGSKVSTKISLLQNLAAKVDYLIVGGGILNTFLAATGKNVANSLYEPDLIPEAKKTIDIMDGRGASILLPDHVLVAKEFSATATAVLKNIDDLDLDDMILDVSEEFAFQLAALISKSKTIIWNGPIGVFEFDNFSRGTEIVASSIAASEAFSLAGGGDTIAAINKYNLAAKISYISTAGGALLEFLEGKKLPAISLLEHYASRTRDIARYR